MVHSLEPIERWVVFRTNHGTDAHLTKVNAVSNIQPYQPVIVTGMVASMPRLVPKRHRIFALKDQTGTVDCAAYEPTGTLRKVARKLIIGDNVEVSGGVRQSTETHPLTINLEKLQILKLTRKLSTHNPKCLKCSKRLKSMGANQGLRCPKCGFQSPSKQKIMVEDSRDVAEKLYITSARSQRHLTKPLSRYGREKAGKAEKMVVHWHHS
jgi:tRNA(Ile2)-agmatinylcytidine synthase